MTRDTLKRLATLEPGSQDTAALRRRLAQLAASDLDPVDIGNQLITEAIVGDLLK